MGQLAHANPSRENCAATYLSRPLCLRFYMQVMFCVKFPSVRPSVRPSARPARARRTIGAESQARARSRSLSLRFLRGSRAIVPPRRPTFLRGDSKESAALDETDAPRRIIATLDEARSPPRAARTCARNVGFPTSPPGIIGYRSFLLFLFPAFSSFFFIFPFSRQARLS